MDRKRSRSISGSRHKRVIREEIETLLGEHLLQENTFQNAMSWIRKKGASAKSTTINFLESLKMELEETRDGATLLVKLVRGQDLTPEENTQLKRQAKDVGKGIPLLALLVLPGGSIAAVALVQLAKKFGVNLMPTSFQDM